MGWLLVVVDNPGIEIGLQLIDRPIDLLAEGAAMRLQSQNALGQGGLLIGPENFIRVDLPAAFPEIGLDDWRAAVDPLPQSRRARPFSAPMSTGIIRN